MPQNVKQRKKTIAKKLVMYYNSNATQQTEGNIHAEKGRDACPVATTVALIGSKWKLLIMRNLMACPWRFNELKRDLEGLGNL